MSDGVGESHRFPPIDGLHDRCCNISNERCRRAPLEFIKSPSPRSAKPASAFSLSCHCILLFSNFSFAKTLYLNRFSISRTFSKLGSPHLTALPPLVPPLFSGFLFCVKLTFNCNSDQLGSTGLNWDQPGSNWDCLIRALFPARFWSFELFQGSLCALCLAIAPRHVCGIYTAPLDCRLIPALKRKFPRLIGSSHNLPGLHSSSPYCFKDRDILTSRHIFHPLIRRLGSNF
ncbi:hypothetical protein N7519_000320 [Penicillium mononematosum]|uniref:uncharacterized protein n=1 Tax=Penicillium mononematosum TaxID=268346 RepID=UPI00254979C0|nr:uncharacterized protein N7519_000320 [Penicillium mononematosum]KAJ6190299.1 hypothetical protein N7519_000320 [Penicillium mononematosum]